MQNPPAAGNRFVPISWHLCLAVGVVLGGCAPKSAVTSAEKVKFDLVVVGFKNLKTRRQVRAEVVLVKRTKGAVFVDVTNIGLDEPGGKGGCETSWQLTPAKDAGRDYRGNGGYSPPFLIGMRTFVLMKGGYRELVLRAPLGNVDLPGKVHGTISVPLQYYRIGSKVLDRQKIEVPFKCMVGGAEK